MPVIEYTFSIADDERFSMRIFSPLLFNGFGYSNIFISGSETAGRLTSICFSFESRGDKTEPGITSEGSVIYNKCFHCDLFSEMVFPVNPD